MAKKLKPMTCLHNNITKGEKMNFSKEKKTFEDLVKSGLVTITITRREPIKLSECFKKTKENNSNNLEENNEL